MRNLVIIIFFLLPLMSFAQTDTVRSNDSVKKSANLPHGIVDAPSIRKKIPEPLYIVDGEIKKSRAVRRAVKDSNILKVEVLKDKAAEAIYAHHSYGAILITTKRYAKVTYQKMLSEFSPSYNTAVTKADDKDFIYTINGIVLNMNGSYIGSLYDLKKENIESVIFDPAKGNLKAKVIITTKKRS